MGKAIFQGVVVSLIVGLIMGGLNVAAEAVMNKNVQNKKDKLKEMEAELAELKKKQQRAERVANSTLSSVDPEAVPSA